MLLPGARSALAFVWACVLVRALPQRIEVLEDHFSREEDFWHSITRIESLGYAGAGIRTQEAQRANRLATFGGSNNG